MRSNVFAWTETIRSDTSPANDLDQRSISFPTFVQSSAPCLCVCPFHLPLPLLFGLLVHLLYLLSVREPHLPARRHQYLHLRRSKKTRLTRSSEACHWVRCSVGASKCRSERLRSVRLVDSTACRYRRDISRESLGSTKRGATNAFAAVAICAVHGLSLLFAPRDFVKDEWHAVVSLRIDIELRSDRVFSWPTDANKISKLLSTLRPSKRVER